jgi:hypothetical protein
MSIESAALQAALESGGDAVRTGADRASTVEALRVELIPGVKS